MYLTNTNYESTEEVIRYRGKRINKFLFFRVGPREIKEVSKSSSGKTKVKTSLIFKNERQRLRYMRKKQ